MKRYGGAQTIKIQTQSPSCCGIRERFLEEEASFLEEEASLLLVLKEQVELVMQKRSWVLKEGTEHSKIGEFRVLYAGISGLGFWCMVKVPLDPQAPACPTALVSHSLPGAPWGCRAGSCRPFVSQAADISAPSCRASSCSLGHDQRKPRVACWPCGSLIPAQLLLLRPVQAQPRCSPGGSVLLPPQVPEPPPSWAYGEDAVNLKWERAQTK